MDYKSDLNIKSKYLWHFCKKFFNCEPESVCEICFPETKENQQCQPKQCLKFRWKVNINRFIINDLIKLFFSCPVGKCVYHTNSVECKISGKFEFAKFFDDYKYFIM